MNTHILNIILFMPFFFAFLLVLIPSRFEKIIKLLAVLVGGLEVLLMIYVAYLFDVDSFQMQLNVKKVWIQSLGINYFVGIDGISLPMLLMTSTLGFIGLLLSWNLQKAIKGFMCLYLILVGSLIGVFLSLDFFMFYMFWNLNIVAIYFLVTIWGEQKENAAATNFLVHSMIGSAILLVVVTSMYFKIEPHTFDLLELRGGRFQLNKFSIIMYFSLIVVFGIRMIVFPLHAWISQIITEASSAVSIFVAGPFIAVGAYGILRICYPIFSEASKEYAYILGVIGLVNLIYGAYNTIRQDNYKNFVSYFAMAAVGFFLLGISTNTVYGLEGSTIYIIMSAFTSGMLIVVSKFMKNRAMSGLIETSPILSGFTIVGILSTVGIPLLGTFVGLSMIIIGIYSQYRAFVSVVLLGLLGIVVGSFRIFISKFLGEVNGEKSDLCIREQICLFVLTFVMLLVGIYPARFLMIMEKTLENLLGLLG